MSCIATRSSTSQDQTMPMLMSSVVSASQNVLPTPGENILAISMLESLPVTAKEITSWTERDPVLSWVRRMLASGWKDDTDAELKPYQQRHTQLSLHDGCVMWGSYPTSRKGERNFMKDTRASRKWRVSPDVLYGGPEWTKHSKRKSSCVRPASEPGNSLQWHWFNPPGLGCTSTTLALFSDTS